MEIVGTKETWSSIPTLFERDDTRKVIPSVRPGCEWVLNSEVGITTIKMDGVLVRVTLEDGKWRIAKRMGADTFMATNREDDLDKPLWEAFDAQDVKSTGMFEVYGKAVRGNPYGIDKNLMIKVFPPDASLIVQKNLTGIRRGPGITPQQLFDMIKKELSESPEIEGLVWHVEGPNLSLVKAAKIKRTDFGLSWPVPVVDPLIIH